MGGPNLAALRAMFDALATSGCTLIASGGVSSLADLRALADLGVEGAIIGKALYVNAIDLAAAVREIERSEQSEQAEQAQSGGIPC
jgi:phosphoribosylformimino-5-aminoimidazole carboxamide ribotide isomerase